MQLAAIIKALQQNKNVFEALLKDLDQKIYLWKPDKANWCLLEIVCHLHDEERDDFRARVKHLLETPNKPFPYYDPLELVIKNRYMEQDFQQMISKFLSERTSSIDWLASLQTPQWENTIDHPRLGPMSAELLLYNWLAHDYLHIRQINRLKYQFLDDQSSHSLSYAGTW